MTVCESCQRGWVEADGEAFEVDAAAVAQAECDAQHIGRVHGQPAAPVSVPSGGSDSATKAAPAPHVGPERPNPAEKAAPAPHVALEGPNPAARAHVSTHGGQDHPHPAAKPERASQTIPPSIRRLLKRRDRGRCTSRAVQTAPSSKRILFDPVSEGGAHDPKRMGYLCSVHHAAVHEGRLIIEGRVSTGLRFLHADGTPYGSTALSPARASMHAQLFGILEGMGFKEREARRAADGIRDELHDDTPMAEAVRLALQAMPVPGRVSGGATGVRETFAEYVRLDPAA